VLLKPLGHLSFKGKSKKEKGKKNDALNFAFFLFPFHGGQGGIRTPGALRTTVFETAAFDHSATCPYSILSHAATVRRKPNTSQQNAPTTQKATGR
jgi:hypothetical protein